MHTKKTKISPAKLHNNRVEILITTPSLLWILALFVFPIVILFSVCFRHTGINGGIASSWTTDTLEIAIQADFIAVIWRTLWITFVITAICISLALPVGFHISRMSTKWRSLFLLLTILPLWNNLLVKIFAWRLFLHQDGFIRKVFVALGMSEDVFLLNNVWSVIAVSVYAFLPLAILPIYAAAERFDSSLIDVACDLGLTRLRAFIKIFIPAVSKGIFTAFVFVFIPAIGSYAIPDLVGGYSEELIGNKIAFRAIFSRNLPEAAAYTGVLAIIIFVTMALYLTFNFRYMSDAVKMRITKK